MGIADKIYEAVKDLPECDAKAILQFAEGLKAKRVTVAPARRRINLDLFRAHRGLYDGTGIEREALYDRAGLR